MASQMRDGYLGSSDAPAMQKQNVTRGAPGIRRNPAVFAALMAPPDHASATEGSAAASPTEGSVAASATDSLLAASTAITPVMAIAATLRLRLLRIPSYCYCLAY
jgi:hypothetical protein